jgi:transposase
VNDPACDGCVAEEPRSYANAGVRAEDSPAHATLAYPVRLYPTAIKSWALGALCELYRRKLNEQLDWCAQQKKLSLKGLKQAGSGEFVQRTKRQAIIAFKRSHKSTDKTGREFQLPYLKAELLPHAETQTPRRAKSFDGWIHIEATGRDWQIYLPFHRHRALDRALAYDGARLSTSTEVYRKNGKWYARVFVTIPFAQPTPTTQWIGGDVGARNAVVCSDGYKGRDLRPIIKFEKLKRARQQRAGVHRSKNKSWQRQVLDREARRLVSVASKSGAGIALEDPLKLIRWQQHAARYFANRVLLLAAIEACPVRLANPAWTSRTCHRCGSRETFRRKQMFRCYACGYTQHADFQASLNIRDTGQPCDGNRLRRLLVSGQRAQTTQARVA